YLPRRAPSPALDPYTTLFRSYVLHWGDGDKVECEADAAPVTHSYAETGTYDLVAVAERDYTAAARLTVRSWVTPPIPGRKLDGRSEEPRLNSSHVKSSYAVFC